MRVFLKLGTVSHSTVSDQPKIDLEELNTLLSTYLPMDRRLALARGESLPDRARGAALFADISDFTPLARDLVQNLGPQRGAEVLTRQLNGLYGTLIAPVHLYGGSVIGFGGDAITCWFDQANNLSGSGDVTECARRAVTCALVMQQAARQFEPTASSEKVFIPVSVKIAVSAGPARRFQVGDPRFRIIDTLAGSTLDRLSAAEQQARQGEVVVDSQTAGRLGDQLAIASWRGDPEDSGIAILASIDRPAEPVPWPDVPPPEASLTRPWLLKPVLQRLERGEGEYLSELRLAVTLFIRFTGLDYDRDDRSGQKLDAYVRWVQSVLANYQGYLMEFVMGDKGSYIQASFGAPVAYGDDAARAVAAALKLHDPPAEVATIRETQIGISQGVVRVGAFGSPTRRVYGVQGDQVIIAARLMASAEPGQILVTPAVARSAADVSEFREIGSRFYKGLETPLLTYEVLNLHRKPSSQTDGRWTAEGLVGRVEEMTRLRKQLAQLQNGQGSNAIIVGEAGIGKSRLMEAFVSQVEDLGIRILIGQGDAIEQATPYHAWRSITLGALGLGESDDQDSILQSVSARLADNLQLMERLPLLNNILRIKVPGNELTAGMSGEVRAGNIGTLLIHLLRGTKAAADPLVVVLDDGHWMDSASWALADRARREMDTLMLVVLMRPMVPGDDEQSLPNGYVKLLDAPETEHYYLETMPADDIITLIRRRLGVKRLPQPVAALIQERAGGHPFFSEEFALALRDTGVIQIDGDEAMLAEEADLRQLEFPDTIQGIITSRIDRLQPGQELTLKVASVIGRVFLFQTLREIYPVPADKPYLNDYLKTLASLDITPVETPEPELSYIFRHAFTQEAAYGLLLYRQRQKLHEAVASWYEKNHVADLSPYFPLLAHHWSKTRVISKAIIYLDKAGEQALLNYANREAVEFLGEALKLAEERPDIAKPMYGPGYRLKRAQWLRLLGEAFLGLGRLKESRATLIQMLALVKRPAPTSRLRLVGSLIRQLTIQILHRLWPGRFLSRASKAESVEFLEAARAHQHLAEIYYFANERILTVNAGLNVLNLSERARPSQARARAYANMAVICGLIPWHGAARAYSRRALETAELVGDRSALAWVNLLVGTYEVGLGHWERTEELANRAITFSRELGDTRQLGLSLGLLALVPILQGDYEASCELYKEWHEIAVKNGNIQHQAFGLFGQAENLLPMGKAEEAGELTRQGLRLLIEETQRTAENRTGEIRGHGILAIAYLRQGEDELAQAAARNAMEVAAQLSAPTRVTLLEGLSGMAETYLALWAKEEAHKKQVPYLKKAALKKAAEESCEMIDRFAKVFDIGRPRTYLWWGLYYWLDGRPERAHESWAKSQVVAEQLGMPPDQALARSMAGKHS